MASSYHCIGDDSTEEAITGPCVNFSQHEIALSFTGFTRPDSMERHSELQCGVTPLSMVRPPV